MTKVLVVLLATRSPEAYAVVSAGLVKDAEVSTILIYFPYLYFIEAFLGFLLALSFFCGLLPLPITQVLVPKQ